MAFMTDVHDVGEVDLAWLNVETAKCDDAFIRIPGGGGDDDADLNSAGRVLHGHRTVLIDQPSHSLLNDRDLPLLQQLHHPPLLLDQRVDAGGLERRGNQRWAGGTLVCVSDRHDQVAKAVIRYPLWPATPIMDASPSSRNGSSTIGGSGHRSGPQARPYPHYVEFCSSRADSVTESGGNDGSVSLKRRRDLRNEDISFLKPGIADGNLILRTKTIYIEFVARPNRFEWKKSDFGIIRETVELWRSRVHPGEISEADSHSVTSRSSP